MYIQQVENSKRKVGYWTFLLIYLKSENYVEHSLLIIMYTEIMLCNMFAFVNICVILKDPENNSMFKKI